MYFAIKYILVSLFEFSSFAIVFYFYFFFNYIVGVYYTRLQISRFFVIGDNL